MVLSSQALAICGKQIHCELWQIRENFLRKYAKKENASFCPKEYTKMEKMVTNINKS
jgi:hypothetical protein